MNSMPRNTAGFDSGGAESFPSMIHSRRAESSAARCAASSACGSNRAALRSCASLTFMKSACFSFNVGSGEW